MTLLIALLALFINGPVTVDVVTRDETLTQHGGWVHFTDTRGDVLTIVVNTQRPSFIKTGR